MKDEGETLDDYLRKHSEVPRNLTKGLQSIVKWQQDLFDKVRLDNEKVAIGFSKMVEAITSSAQAAFAEHATRLKLEPDAIKFLADIGWYLPVSYDGSIAQLVAAGPAMKRIQSGQLAQVETELINYFNREAKRILRQLQMNFPSRTKQIKAAFTAHEKGMYYLSIPVFFALIEGVCQELTGWPFFSQRSVRKFAKRKESEVYFPILLEPLKLDNSIAKKSQGKNSKPTGLNRHDVLHGRSVDYGEDPLNSYKALSLLNYVGITLHQTLTKERRDKKK